MDNVAIKEFFLVALEYCKLVEYTSDINRFDFISKAQKLLSAVYLKASLLEKPENIVEGEVEKFVQEDDWIYIKNNTAKILGGNDQFIDVILPERNVPENNEEIKLSEGFADIYQDLKDFVTSYEIGNNEGIEASLFECLINYEKFWGQRILAILTFLHNFIYYPEFFEDDNDIFNRQETDTKSWPINKRFEE